MSEGYETWMARKDAEGLDWDPRETCGCRSGGCELCDPTDADEPMWYEVAEEDEAPSAYVFDPAEPF